MSKQSNISSLKNKKIPQLLRQNAIKEKSFQVPSWSVAVVLGFTALLYFRSIYNGFVNWDDDNYIFQNPFIKDFSVHGIIAIFSCPYFGMYHPFTTLTYLFDHTLFGTNPLPYHVLNILLHLLNTWLVYKFIKLLSNKKLTALVVSLLFAIHPMHVESVCWISERKDVLYTFFYLLSLIVYMSYLKTGFVIRHYILTLLLFTASLLSKPAAITLPVLLITIDIYIGRKISKRMFMEKIPFLLLAILFGLLTMSQTAVKLFHDLSIQYNFFERIFLITYSLALYLTKMIAPFQLCAIYYYPGMNGGPLTWAYYASLPLLVILAWLVFRKNILRREILFGASFFLITISVMLQIFPNFIGLACDRYTYVSYIGLFFIAGQFISYLLEKKRSKFVMPVFALFVLLFSWLTWERIDVWKDGDILFSDVVNKNPGIFHGYWIRGKIRDNKGDSQGALDDFNKALELKPGFAAGLVDRGSVQNKLNDYAGALKDLKLAIRLDSASADADAYNSRGMAYYGLGDAKSALPDFNKAIFLKPDFAEALDNRGVMFFSTGDTKSALLDYNKAISLKPDFGDAYYNRCILKVNIGDLEGAVQDINIAIKLSPQDAELYGNRGYIKNKLKDYQDAIKDFNMSLEIKPGYAVAYFNRGVAYLNLKDTTAAYKDWQKAKELGYASVEQLIKTYCAAKGIDEKRKQK